MEQPVFRIDVSFDEEAGVWYVCDSEVPGLVAEAPTEEELLALLQVRVPELIELNRPDLCEKQPVLRRAFAALAGHPLGRSFVELDVSVRTHRRLSVACG
jgi:Domain of unknown function (DUF1902)